MHILKLSKRLVINIYIQTQIVDYIVFWITD